VIADPAGSGDGADNGIRVTMPAPLPGAQPVLKDFDQKRHLRRALRWLCLFRRGHIACGAYGLFPVRSDGGLIRDCTATGHTDAGIYVGSSTDITVRDCRAWANVVGIEVSMPVHRCPEQPGLRQHRRHWSPPPARRSVTTLPTSGLHGNVVIGRQPPPNFGEPANLVFVRPSGLGILVVGADRC